MFNDFKATVPVEDLLIEYVYQNILYKDPVEQSQILCTPQSFARSQSWCWPEVAEWL